MDAARRLWPRVKAMVEAQISQGEIDLDLGAQRRLTAAVVSDLLEAEKSGRGRRRAALSALPGRVRDIFRSLAACGPRRPPTAPETPATAHGPAHPAAHGTSHPAALHNGFAAKLASADPTI